MLEALTGTGLAASAGLNAYIPLLTMGLLARYTDLMELPDGWQWISGGWAIGILVVLLAVEVVADKVPVLDHALDTVGMVVKPAVGTMVAAAMFVKLPPFAATLLGLAVGGTVATTVGLAKAKVRLLSSLTTGTMLNPVLSFVEDLVSTVIAAIALIAPFLALLFILVIVAYAVRRLHKSLGPPPPDPRQAGPG